MALHMDHKALSAGSWTSLDLAAERVGDFVCKFSDSAPASLEFSVVAPQHTFPIGLRHLVRFWDDNGTTPDGAPQSDGNPLFEGYVWECQPAESNLLKYVAYDPSQMAGNEIPVMSAPWEASIDGNPPQPEGGAVPRLIVNSMIDNDADWPFERAHDLKVGKIIELVLTDALSILRWYQAAPGSDVAYLTAETALFDFIPQEKVVSTNESLRAFIMRLVQNYYPEYAFRWEPGTHYWRWYSRLNTTGVTLTLNDPSPANGLNVLSMELHRSLDGRYPAVTYYGPETTEAMLFSTLDDTLEAIDDPVTLETYTDIHGTGSVVVHAQFQIVDSTKRRGARLLPAVSTVRDDDYHYVATRSPMFEVSYDSGSTWQAVESCIFDFQTGTVYFGEGLYTYIWTDHPPAGTTQHFYAPNAYRLIWAPYTAPLTVRAPASGFEGTSFTVAGQTSELRVYDDMLSVGYNRLGHPVTTASRVEQFQILVTAQLAAKKDIVYAGGCILEGLQYEFCRMARAINLAAVDSDGNAVTTGWESITAVISDIEYDFANQTTTLTFSQEALNVWGDNVDKLKMRLKIHGNLERVRSITTQNQWRDETSLYANHPAHFKTLAGVVYNDQDLYYDPLAGTLERAL